MTEIPENQPIFSLLPNALRSLSHEGLPTQDLDGRDAEIRDLASSTPACRSNTRMGTHSYFGGGAIIHPTFRTSSLHFI
jgi:hypothetical protein